MDIQYEKELQEELEREVRHASSRQLTATLRADTHRCDRNKAFDYIKIDCNNNATPGVRGSVQSRTWFPCSAQGQLSCSLPIQAEEPLRRQPCWKQNINVLNCELPGYRGPTPPDLDHRQLWNGKLQREVDINELRKPIQPRRGVPLKQRA